MIRWRLCYLVSLFAMMGSALALDFHLAPDGADDGDGSARGPFRNLEQVRGAILARQAAVGKEAISVWVRGGRYPIVRTVTFGTEFAGTRDFPIRIRAVEGEKPVFDAGLELKLADAKVVSDEGQLGRFAAAARGKVMGLKVSDARFLKLLGNGSLRMSCDGRMMSVARYPNVGFAHIERIHEKGAVYARGRTKGAPPKWSVSEPIGGRFTVLGKDVSPWEEELKVRNEMRVRGYLAYDWYQEAHSVGGVSNGQVQLASYSRYGVIAPKGIPRRFRAINLLCELDAPGEFCFDEAQATLFFIPPSSLKPSSRLSLWGGPGLVSFRGASYMSLEGVVVEGVGTGPAAVQIDSCDHVILIGCTVRNCSRTGVNVEGGSDSGLRSCDLYDVSGHLNLGGGDVGQLIPARNFAINCQFTQVEAADFYGRIRVTGVGQVFRNNLVHYCPGQIMTFGGCDHRIALNEFFNIGFEEGDGGAIYSGASAWSWGNMLEHNFLHHLMCIPQAHPRGGIYPDDGDMGDTISQNVFYKAAHRAVLINGGAGQTVRGNLFLEGHIGIYNIESYGERRYSDISRFESGELKRGDKGDWIWRTEQVIGEEGWNKRPWSRRFPRFRKIMNQERMRHFPIECEFSGNRFSGNWRNIEWRVGRGDAGVREISEVKMVENFNNEGVAMSVFRDPGALDFRYKSGSVSVGMPKIPFDQIGLRVDRFRRNPPKPSEYRAAVRKHFEGQKSYDPKAVYDPKKINDEIYFNSGRLLLEAGGMIH